MMGEMAQEAEDRALAEECRLSLLADPNCRICNGTGIEVLTIDDRDGGQEWGTCSCVREDNAE